VVEPKRQRLRTAQTALDAMNAKFAEKREQLLQIERKVRGSWLPPTCGW